MRIEYKENQSAEFSSHAQFQELHPDAIILAVNDVPVIGTCAICGDPIAAGDTMQQCSDGSMVCEVCMARQRASR